MTGLAEGLTEELAQLAVGWEHPDPSGAKDLAERAVVDTVAVTLAASQDPTVAALFRGVGEDLHGGPASVWARNLAGDSRTTALVNGACAHALDFDDVDDQMIGHPSAVLVPAVVAQGEELAASGVDVLESYWVGLAASRALAAALGIDSHYRAGWHSTGTIGTVAAAAAGIRLRRLSMDQARHTLGIAGSLAAGSRQNFGTMTKPLHAGVAAANAILATRLGAAGFTADTSQLERPLGFLALHDAAPGERRLDPARMAEPELNVKLHACCYYIHAAADAMLDLAAAGLHPHDVRRIRVFGPPDGFGALIHHRPRTGLEGKFSMEYAMAACLLDQSLGLHVFTDESVRRPEAQRLIEAVELEASETPPSGPPEWEWGYAVVSVETTDGRQLTHRVDKPRGHASRPIAEADLRKKFDDCLAYGGFEPDDRLYKALRGLREAASLREVTGLVTELTARAGVPGSSSTRPATHGRRA
jgi:2-methylcitrate dehydratase PrpD